MKTALWRLPKPVRGYFHAVATNDSQALANCFTADGVIVDVDRAIAGRNKIRQWAEEEVLGGSYKVIDSSGDGEKVSILLRFAPRDEESFRARYEFELQDGQILTANLQYV
jgi:hypothetical protein